MQLLTQQAESLETIREKAMLLLMAHVRLLECIGWYDLIASKRLEDGSRLSLEHRGLPSYFLCKDGQVIRQFGNRGLEALEAFFLYC